MTRPFELWVWVVKEADGQEGTIAAMIPGSEHLGLMVLQGRTREVADRLGGIAMRHGEASGRPVRLVHLQEVQT
jgi:hypothetical protein